MRFSSAIAMKLERHVVACRAVFGLHDARGDCRIDIQGVVYSDLRLAVKGAVMGVFTSTVHVPRDHGANNVCFLGVSNGFGQVSVAPVTGLRSEVTTPNRGTLRTETRRTVMRQPNHTAAGRGVHKTT